MIRLADNAGWIELEARPPKADYEVYPAIGRFSRGGLVGQWNLDLFDPSGFADEIDEVYRCLKGRADLSDHDGLSLGIEVDKVGRVEAKVWMNGNWNFGIDGDLTFEIHIDQTYLPALSETVRSTFPLVPSAQRRAKNDSAAPNSASGLS